MKRTSTASRRPAQEQIVIVGKGGIGKSVIASNLSLLYARKGRRVLHVGCDPKRDSTRTIGPEKPSPTVVDRLLLGAVPRLSEVLAVGREGIHCVEAGGPQPGRGCAGRGLTATLQLIEESGTLPDYSIVMFDLLGDVVCGGFAAPLRKGFGRKVVIVTSDEWMSLWAANNIARMVVEYADNGVCLAGLAVNARMNRPHETRRVEAFAKAVGTQVLDYLPWDASLERCATAGQPLVAEGDDSPLAQKLSHLADAIVDVDPRRRAIPRPMDDAAFDDFVQACR